MADSQSDAVVNRDEPIPVVSVTGPASGSSTPLRRPSHTFHQRSHSSPRAALNSLRPLPAVNKARERQGIAGEKRPESSSSVQDRLLNMLLSQIIPSDGPANGQSGIDRQSRKYVDRPGFSLPLMSNNFRRFNARIGVVFVFQNRMIRLFTWRTQSHTLAFLALYTFVCLNPPLLAVVPLAVCVFYIMIPAFLARHPPPPEHLKTDLDMYPLSGPPLAPPPKIKPAPELSKDFFRNMRDLQNSMEDFSRLHDAAIAYLAPLTNFSNESLSSTLFILLLFSCFLLFITAHLLPWRFVALVAGWSAICAGHPDIQALLETPENKLNLESQEKEAQMQFKAFSTADIILDPEPEKREVEIFELQHKPLHDVQAEWEGFVFSPSPYNPLSPSRIAGDRPRGTRFFEDVVPPKGFRWADKKWTLDLLSKEWVDERMISGVEVEVAGERWVTDILYDEDDNVVEEVTLRPKAKVQDKVVTWEEGTGQHKLGEWRRRRWFRVVERIPEKKIKEEVLVSED